MNIFVLPASAPVASTRAIFEAEYAQRQPRGEDFRHQREARALVPAHRQQPAAGEDCSRVVGGAAGSVEPPAGLGLLPLAAIGAHLAERRLAHGNVEHHRLISDGNANSQRIVAQQRTLRAERSHRRHRVGGADADHAGLGCTIGIGMGATPVRGVGRQAEADAGLSGARDCFSHGAHAAVATRAPIALQDAGGRPVLRQSQARRRVDSPPRQGAQHPRQHADAVRRHAEQV